MDIEAGVTGGDEQHSWAPVDSSVDAMAHISSDLDDLTNIFDIADFDLDSLQPVDTQHFDETVQKLHTSAHNTPYLDALSQPIQGSVAHDFAESDPAHVSHLLGKDGRPHQAHTDIKLAPGQFQGSAWQHFPSAHTQTYNNAMAEQYGSDMRIPPTPNSYEMHGETGHFLQQQQAIFAQQKHIQNMESQMHGVQLQHQPSTHPAHFTPLTSPSGTPQYAMQPEFTTPGAYFSPLTSPALHAQVQPSGNQQILQQSQGCFTNPSTAPSSSAPSPVDLGSGDIDMVNGSFLAETAANSITRRPRKKPVAPRSVGPAARVRQSPIQKPQKRKSGILLPSTVPGRELESAIVEGQVTKTATQPSSATGRVSQAFDSSESGSISPEPLSEILMRPPPRPGTSAHEQLHAAVDAAMARKAAAATPKSILSMRRAEAGKLDTKLSPPETSSLLGTPTVNAVGQMSLDDLELPEAASKQTSRRTPVVLTGENQTKGTPLSVNTSRKTPKLGPLSTPSSARPDDSPTVVISPTSASTPAALLKDKKSNGRPSRSLSKRGSVSGGAPSATVSPSIRPRVSPSIKPLLPEGSSLHSPTHALLLASKSNYQNLLEGNHLPGVNYPDSLSTGLTSKRTSHKVAEQGRRNRINEALKEMQSLIPSTASLATKSTSEDGTAIMKDEDDSADAAPGVDGDGNDGKESASAKSNSSKAATVESANRYIRLLKESDATQRAAIMALKQENEEIRRRLAEAVGGESTDEASAAAASIDMPSIQEHGIAADS